MNIIHYLNRPEYFFRPQQVINRILATNQDKSKEYKFVKFPWGVNINISTNIYDPVNLAVSRTGVYDLIVTEILWRLLDSGETAVDVGANIGYMTGLMAARTGKTGKVYSFEPNPEVYRELLKNIHEWQSNLGWNHINLEQIALSDRTGIGLLCVSENREAGKLTEASVSNSSTNYEQTYNVTIKRMDEVINDDIGVMKLDVEGHELSVLQGATKLITHNRIRDIVFEEHKGYPSSVSDFLEAQGYKIFRIWKGFWKPILHSPEQNYIHPWEPPSFLATLDEKRVKTRLQKSGWMSLNGK
ncbi:FkbM family methyltransferase [Nostoc sp. FACHB-110]|uniref:FkbM family methyltransferase n=1 Tax=Nostoc sp. FACHB-110 TaxID=2692834 RepID=UPI0016821982|nr:FkbM family methyltransferase [Nostoc sp. FACHB-110]MBD2437145.1 FkbM family methyltransferase [Nostoc sp. FACHB-110]